MNDVSFMELLDLYVKFLLCLNTGNYFIDPLVHGSLMLETSSKNNWNIENVIDT